LTYGLNRIVGRQETVGESFVLPEESEQEVFGLDAGSAELAGFVAGEKDDAAGFFGIALEHDAPFS
jgi:hypothetical protein